MSDNPVTSLRFDSESQRELWRLAAEQQNRSLSNWIKTVCDKVANEQLEESQIESADKKRNK